MEIVFISLGLILILVGLAGAFLPVLPGTPFSYLGILVLHFSGVAEFSTFFLVTWAIVIIVIQILDNILPVYATKKFGGSVYGTTGSTIGMILGMLFFPPLGFFLGTLLGAFVGEMIYKQDVNIALKSAWGSFVGFLGSTVIKVTVAAMLAFAFFSAIL
jgi:uncharacterized protein YqgC (DUF456 family)